MKKLIILIFLVMLIAAPKVMAQVNWPPSPGFGTPLNTNSTITDLIEYLYEWLISLGGFAAFIVLVAAGFKYLTSAGDPGKMKEAKDWIKSVLLGLILLFSSVLILNVINPQLTTLRMPLFQATTTDFNIKIEDVTKNMILCDRVEIYSAANFEGPMGNVKPGKCGPERGTAEINSIKIFGSCTVEFYSTECKNRELIHVVSFLATKEKANTTDEEYFNLEKDISYEENTVRRVKVKEIKL